MLEIDGSYGEGGGQVLRMAVALSAITGKELKIRNIRAKRARPGLASQHITAVRAVSELCNASVRGLELGSNSIEFKPGELKGGEFHFDVGTAGAVTLVLQASLLPALLAKHETLIDIVGGTDVSWSPPIDYLTYVLVPLLSKMGASVQIETIKRGYYPKGGGKIRARIEPCNKLVQLNIPEKGKLLEIKGCINLTSLPLHVAERMRAAALKPISKWSPSISIDTAVSERGPGTGIVLWARTEHTIIGASCLGKRGVRAEEIGEKAATSLLAEILSPATLDIHAADQLIPYIAIAPGTGGYLTREVSRHAETNAWLVSQFLDRKFHFNDIDGGKKVEVSD